MTQTLVGIIGGSGLYQMEGLQDAKEHSMQTPFGNPSDAIVTGTVSGVGVAFLARHGRGHRLLPTEVPYRANIHALKQLGVRYVLSVSAVGSLREDFKPLDMVLPDQFIDMTKRRESSFFGNGAVAHVSMAQPVCALVSDALARAVRLVLEAESAQTRGNITLHQGGTYVCMEGPQFSTQAESHWYRSMGAAIIGMTNMPEAKLAREAELCYCSVSMVTDFDCWHPGHDAVTVDSVIRVLLGNAQTARTLVAGLAGTITEDAQASGCSCRHALDQALITAPEARDPAVVERLRVIAGRVLGAKA